MKKKIFILVFTFALFLSVRLFCGVYVHDEFLDEYFFIKHRPTFKWKFHSPLRMSDLNMEDLSKEEQIEQKYFNEFVKDQGLSR